jgi:hypothetical protein
MAGTRVRTAKQEIAIAMAEALVHPILVGIDNSSFPPVTILILEAYGDNYS